MKIEVTIKIDSKEYSAERELSFIGAIMGQKFRNFHIQDSANRAFKQALAKVFK